MAKKKKYQDMPLEEQGNKGKMPKKDKKKGKMPKGLIIILGKGKKKRK